MYFETGCLNLSDHTMIDESKGWLACNAPHLRYFREMVFRCPELGFWGSAIFRMDKDGTRCEIEDHDCDGFRTLVCDLPRVKKEIQTVIEASKDGRLDAEGYADVIDVLVLGTECYLGD